MAVDSRYDPRVASWSSTWIRHEHRWLIAALTLAATLRLGTAGWGLPMRYHVDELGFVMWVAAFTEYAGMNGGTFQPGVTTYGPLVYELALGVKWALSGFEPARIAARSVADGWAYMRLLDDPTRTPIVMADWVYAMRIVSGCASVAMVWLLSRTARRLGGIAAGVAAAFIAALAPGLIQVGHFYTPDSLILLFTAVVFDGASRLFVRPSFSAAAWAGIGIGLVLATKLTGAFVALSVPIAIAFTPSASPWVRWVRAVSSPYVMCAVATSIGVYVACSPWVLERGLSDYGAGGGPTSGAFMIRTLYETDFAYGDWRFVYRGQPRGWTFIESLLPSVLGWPVWIAALAGAVTARRGERWLLAAGFLPTFALVSGWTVLTIRYALPLAPAAVLAASFAVARLAELELDPRRVVRGVARGGVAALGVATLLHGVAWAGMFLEEDPRTLASRYVAEHARPGDIVVAEADLAYTPPLNAGESSGITPWELPPVEVRRLDPTLGWEGNAAVLEDARFVLVGEWLARRAQHPDALRVAPDVARFYADLLGGRTRFREVARFERQPRLGPLRWDESDEEQLFVCFDHPWIRVFETTTP